MCEGKKKSGDDTREATSLCVVCLVSSALNIVHYAQRKNGKKRSLVEH